MGTLGTFLIGTVPVETDLLASQPAGPNLEFARGFTKPDMIYSREGPVRLPIWTNMPKTIPCMVLGPSFHVGTLHRPSGQ